MLDVFRIRRAAGRKHLERSIDDGKNAVGKGEMFEDW
jgi:hypothetical protein